MSDADPTASIHAAKPTLDSNGNLSTAKVVRNPYHLDTQLDSNGAPLATVAPTRQRVADQWFNATCLIAFLAACIAFIGLGFAFETTSGYRSEFNPAAGLIGAVGAVMGLLPFIGIFAVLRTKDA